jgi:hypothetical protein
MTLSENVHYVATVQVKRIAKTIASEPGRNRGEVVKHEAARSETTVLNLVLSHDKLVDLLMLVQQHLQIHATTTVAGGGYSDT